MSDKIYYIAHSGDEFGNLLNGGTRQLGFEFTRYHNGLSATSSSSHYVAEKNRWTLF